MNEETYIQPRRKCSKCRGHGSTPPDATVMVIHDKLVDVHKMATVDATAQNIYDRLPRKVRSSIAMPSVHNALKALDDLGAARSQQKAGVRARVWAPVEQPAIEPLSIT